jgi:site-specific DNA recombinase
LRNIVYVGKVRYKDEIHDGEQPAIIDPVIFQRVQDLLRQHGPRLAAALDPDFLGEILTGAKKQGRV